MDLTGLATVASAAEPELTFAQQKEEQRRRNFKATHDQDDMRRKREETQIKIRKSKKEERLHKRRHQRRATDAPGDNELGTSDEAMAEQLRRLPEMVAAVRSADPAAQLRGTAQFRKLLSIERKPPIDDVIAEGVVPRLCEFLRYDGNNKLQFEAAWALTNIASGTSEHTAIVVSHNAIPLFVHLLSSTNDDVREQAVWALGNIAGDSAELRDRVLRSGALLPLLRQLRLNVKLGMLRNSTWTLSNFCRAKPAPDFVLVQPALDTLAHLIFSQDEEVLTDACWALSYLSDGTNEKIQAVIQAGVCRRLMELLVHPAAAVQTPALRTVGNIVTGDDLQTQVVINCGALQCLLRLLTHSKRKGIQKEACWTISNITAGSTDQIQAVLDNNLIVPLIKLLQTGAWDIRKEAAWAISNATSGGTAKQVKHLVEQGCIAPLCELLDAKDPKIVSVALEGLENILKVGDQDMKTNGSAYNEHARWVEEASGVERLENLWSHDDHEIYYKAVRILQSFWDAVEEGVDDDELDPNETDAGTLNFGVEAGKSMGMNFAAPSQ